jgi:4-methylaminobutanoate oxidase (formaldehyde-forming)
VREHARAVVVGGGVAGCSIAYHLARLGSTEVAVRTGKDFLGRDALLAAREDTANDENGRRLRCLTLDDPRVVCLGTEPVRMDGIAWGRVTSGGYGYRVGESIAFAYLPATVAPQTRVHVGVFGVWREATVREEPLYDPRSARIRA